MHNFCFCFSYKFYIIYPNLSKWILVFRGLFVCFFTLYFSFCSSNFFSVYFHSTSHYIFALNVGLFWMFYLLFPHFDSLIRSSAPLITPFTFFFINFLFSYLFLQYSIYCILKNHVSNALACKGCRVSFSACMAFCEGMFYTCTLTR